MHVGQLIFTMSGSCTAHSCTFRARTQSRNFQKVLAVLERNEYTVTKGSKKRMRTGSN